MQRLIWITLLFAISAIAQDIPELRLVGEPVFAENEFVGVRDVNGRLCAAIKVISDLDGLRYTSYNGIVRVDDLPGQDMVYLSADERVLEIYCTGFKPKKIILYDVGIRLQSKAVWEIQITGDEKKDPIPVTLLTEPEGAAIRIDGGSASTELQHLLVPGIHRNSAAKPGYAVMDTVVSVDLNHALVRLRLQARSEKAVVDITVTPPDATILLTHTTGRTFTADGSHTFAGLPPGEFEYRITHRGYEPRTGQISVKAGQRLRGRIGMQPIDPKKTGLKSVK